MVLENTNILYFANPVETLKRNSLIALVGFIIVLFSPFKKKVLIPRHVDFLW